MALGPSSLKRPKDDMTKEARKKLSLTLAMLANKRGTHIQCTMCELWTFLSDERDPEEVNVKFPNFECADVGAVCREKNGKLRAAADPTYVKARKKFISTDNGVNLGTVVWVRNNNGRGKSFPGIVHDDLWDTHDYVWPLKYLGSNASAKMISTVEPTHYHVMLFDTELTHFWVRANKVVPWRRWRDLVSRSNPTRHGTLELKNAIEMAKEAFSTPICDRRIKYNYVNLHPSFKGVVVPPKELPGDDVVVMTETEERVRYLLRVGEIPPGQNAEDDEGQVAPSDMSYPFISQSSQEVRQAVADEGPSSPAPSSQPQVADAVPIETSKPKEKNGQSNKGAKKRKPPAKPATGQRRRNGRGVDAASTGSSPADNEANKNSLEDAASDDYHQATSTHTARGSKKSSDGGAVNGSSAKTVADRSTKPRKTRGDGDDEPMSEDLFSEAPAAVSTPYEDDADAGASGLALNRRRRADAPFTAENPELKENHPPPSISPLKASTAATRNTVRKTTSDDAPTKAGGARRASSQNTTSQAPEAAASTGQPQGDVPAGKSGPSNNSVARSRRDASPVTPPPAKKKRSDEPAAASVKPTIRREPTPAMKDTLMSFRSFSGGGLTRSNCPSARMGQNSSSTQPSTLARAGGSTSVTKNLSFTLGGPTNSVSPSPHWPTPVFGSQAQVEGMSFGELAASAAASGSPRSSLRIPGPSARQAAPSRENSVLMNSQNMGVSFSQNSSGSSYAISVPGGLDGTVQELDSTDQLDEVFRSFSRSSNGRTPARM